jgi:hypothetical protein
MAFEKANVSCPIGGSTSRSRLPGRLQMGDIFILQAAQPGWDRRGDMSLGYEIIMGYNRHIRIGI